MGLILPCVALMMLITQPGLAQLAVLIIAVIPFTIFVAAVLYLINLPFVVLAFKSPFYRKRFDRMFRIGLGRSPFAAVPSDLDVVVCQIVGGEETNRFVRLCFGMTKRHIARMSC